MKVGINSGFIGDADVFLNRFKLCGEWAGIGATDAQGYYPDSMNLDANGYPTNLNCKVGSPAAVANSTFSSIFAKVFAGGAIQWPFAPDFDTWYKSGTWQILWDGAGSISVGDDASGASGIAGGLQFTATATGLGMKFTITPPVTNIRLYGPTSTLTAAQSRALHEGGELFNPDYIAKFEMFDTIRFMDWHNTNANTIVSINDFMDPARYSWSERVLGNGQTSGVVPIPVCIALCNRIGANAWFNMPWWSDATMFADYAAIVHNGYTDNDDVFWPGLQSPLKVYVEWANEPWNVGELRAVGTERLARDGYTAYPAMKAPINGGAGGARFTASIADDGNGTSSTMTVTAAAGGTDGFIRTVQATGGSFNRLFYNDGSEVGGVGGYVVPQSQLTGSAGSTGTYTIEKPNINVSSQVLTQGAEFSAWLQNSIRQSIRAGKAFKDEFVGEETRVVTMLNPQSISGVQIAYMLPQTADAYGGNAADWTGDAGDNVDAVCIAPYFLSAIDGDTTSQAEMLAQAALDMQAAADNYVPMNVAAVADYGLQVICYEGGQSYYARNSNTGSHALFGAAQRQPEFYDMYTSFFEQAEADGCALFVHFHSAGAFSDVSPIDNNGNFGLIENVLQTPGSYTPKYNALVDFIAAREGQQYHTVRLEVSAA